MNGVAASPPARKARRSSTLASSNHADNARMASCAPGGAQPASTRTCHNVVSATPTLRAREIHSGPHAAPVRAPRERPEGVLERRRGGDRPGLLTAEAS